MKNFKLLTIPALLILLSFFTLKLQAQQTVTLQPEKPAPGQTVKVIYHPNSPQTLITTPDSLQLVFSFAPYQYSQPDSFDMHKTANGWSAKVPLSRQFKFGSFYFKSGKKTDKNSDGHHYELFAYKQGVPVKGAYLLKAESLDPKYASRYKEAEKNLSQIQAGLYKKELAQHPENYKAQMNLYHYQLTQAGVDSADVLRKAHQRINQKLKENPGSYLVMSDVKSGYQKFGEKAKGDSVEKVMIKKHPKTELAMVHLFDQAKKEKDRTKKAQMLQQYVNAHFQHSAVSKYYGNLAYKDLLKYYSTHEQTDKMKYTAQHWLQDNPRVLYYPSKSRNLSEAAKIIAKNTTQYDLASRYAHQALKLLPDEPASSALTNHGMVRRYVSKKDSLNYEKTYKSDIYATLGMIYTKQKKYDQAETALNKALNISDDNEDANKYLAHLYLKTNRPKQAFESYKQLLMKKPTDEDLRKKLKKSYIAYHGSKKGYRKQTNALHNAWHDKMVKKFREEMMDKDAPSLAQAVDLNGQPMDTTALNGNVVVLDFWATWCGPCKSSFPHMQKIYKKYKDNRKVQFVIMNSAWSNTRKQAVKWTKKQDYSFPYFYDKNSEITTAYGVRGIPTTFVLGKDGNIKFKDIGYEGPAMEPKLELKINMLLNRKSAVTSKIK